MNNTNVEPRTDLELFLKNFDKKKKRQEKRAEM